jgi:hypothetical protein
MQGEEGIEAKLRVHLDRLRVVRWRVAIGNG